jgi:hypothetical protein
MAWALSAPSGHSAVAAGTCSAKSVGEMLAKWFVVNRRRADGRSVTLRHCGGHLWLVRRSPGLWAPWNSPNGLTRSSVAGRAGELALEGCESFDDLRGLERSVTTTDCDGRNRSLTLRQRCCARRPRARRCNVYGRNTVKKGRGAARAAGPSDPRVLTCPWTYLVRRCQNAEKFALD